MKTMSEQWEITKKAILETNNSCVICKKKADQVLIDCLKPICVACLKKKARGT